tara:strand:+ start:4853 stop:5557 length:705 start_codon:yes stop_codon:yes gene_type:complete
MKSEKLSIIIPTFNEEKIIKKVIQDWIKVTKKINSKIIVINDGSTDQTLRILKKINYKKLIILNQKNAGHGPALLKGYNYALKTKTDYIFQVDSDNQFFASDFKKFWKNRKNYDLVLGFRKKRFDDNIRLIITKICRYLILLVFGSYIQDANVPYRLMKKKFLIYSFKNFNLKVNVVNIFLSIIASKKGFKIKSINVKHKKRLTGTVWIVSYKLFLFCIESLFNILWLRFKLLF